MSLLVKGLLVSALALPLVSGCTADTADDDVDATEDELTSFEAVDVSGAELRELGDPSSVLAYDAVTKKVAAVKFFASKGDAINARITATVGTPSAFIIREKNGKYQSLSGVTTKKEGDEWVLRGTIPASGDYMIAVRERLKKPSSFRMVVRRSMDDIPGVCSGAPLSNDDVIARIPQGQSSYFDGTVTATYYERSCSMLTGCSAWATTTNPIIGDPSSDVVWVGGMTSVDAGVFLNADGGLRLSLESSIFWYRRNRTQSRIAERFFGAAALDAPLTALGLTGKSFDGIAPPGQPSRIEPRITSSCVGFVSSPARVFNPDGGWRERVLLGSKAFSKAVEARRPDTAAPPLATDAELGPALDRDDILERFPAGGSSLAYGNRPTFRRFEAICQPKTGCGNTWSPSQISAIGVDRLPSVSIVVSNAGTLEILLVSPSGEKSTAPIAADGKFGINYKHGWTPTWMSGEVRKNYLVLRPDVARSQKLSVELLADASPLYQEWNATMPEVPGVERRFTASAALYRMTP